MLNLVYYFSAAAVLVTMPVSDNLPTSGSQSITMSAQVPVICRVSHSGELTNQGEAYGLGKLHEYCNAPGGFSLEVNYTPGSLKGAALQVGEKSIILDGSGNNEVMRVGGPKVLSLDLSSTPGINGFDSNYLTFEVIPQ